MILCEIYFYFIKAKDVNSVVNIYAGNLQCNFRETKMVGDTGIKTVQLAVLSEGNSVDLMFNAWNLI